MQIYDLSAEVKEWADEGKEMAFARRWFYRCHIIICAEIRGDMRVSWSVITS